MTAHEPVDVRDLLVDDPEALRALDAAAPRVERLLRAVAAAKTSAHAL